MIGRNSARSALRATQLRRRLLAVGFLVSATSGFSTQLSATGVIALVDPNRDLRHLPKELFWYGPIPLFRVLISLNLSPICRSHLVQIGPAWEVGKAEALVPVPTWTVTALPRTLVAHPIGLLERGG